MKKCILKVFGFAALMALMTPLALFASDPAFYSYVSLYTASGSSGLGQVAANSGLINDLTNYMGDKRENVSSSYYSEEVGLRTNWKGKNILIYIWAIPNEGSEFAGWYMDDACTKPIEEDEVVEVFDVDSHGTMKPASTVESSVNLPTVESAAAATKIYAKFVKTASPSVAAVISADGTTTNGYATLQAAINAAKDGAVITLLSGFSTDEAISVSGKVVEIRTEDYATAAAPTIGLRTNYVDQNKIAAQAICYFRKPGSNPAVEIDRMLVGDFEKAVAALSTINETESPRCVIGLYGDVALQDDLVLPPNNNKGTTSSINIKANCTFDLNGHSITQTPGTGWSNVCVFDVACAYAIPALDEMEFTLKDSQKTGAIYTPLHVMHVDPNTTVNIQDVKMVYGVACTAADVAQDTSSGGQAVVVIENYGKVNLSGSTIVCDKNTVLTGEFPWSLLPYAGVISVESGYYEGLMWEGDGFGDLNITGGTYASDYVCWFTADGYVAVNVGESLWKVVPMEDAVASITYGEGTLDEYTDYFLTLDDATAAAERGDTIKLLVDLDLTQYEAYAYHCYMLEGVTLDLGGHTITSKNTGVVYDGDDAVIRNGSFVAANSGSYAIFVGNGTYDRPATGIVLEDLVCTGGINVFVAEVLIKDVNITQNGKYYAVWGDEGSDVTIESGLYTAPASGNVLRAYATGSVKAKGGVYGQAVAEEYIADGYACVANTDAATKDAYPWKVDVPIYIPVEPVEIKVEVVEGSEESGTESVQSPIVVTEKWVEDNVTPAGEKATAAEVMQALNATQDNGLKGWENYVAGFDPNAGKKPLSPTGGNPDSSNVVVVTTYVMPNPPKIGTGFKVEYVLYQVTLGADGKVASKTEKARGATPDFPLTLTALEPETYWKIELEFTSVQTEE